MSLPALILITVVGLTAIVALRTQLGCVDAAREAARAAARGDSAVAAGRRVAPAAARIEVSTTADRVRVTVTARVHPLGGRLPGFDVSATATAALEPGVAATQTRSASAGPAPARAPRAPTRALTGVAG